MISQQSNLRKTKKGHRRDLHLSRWPVMGLMFDVHGWPLCCELWPGNTVDVTMLLPVVNRLRERFRVRRVCIVADRGMISAQTIAVLESREVDCDDILGARMRSVKVLG
jgi:transposase